MALLRLLVFPELKCEVKALFRYVLSMVFRTFIGLGRVGQCGTICSACLDVLGRYQRCSSIINSFFALVSAAV